MRHYEIVCLVHPDQSEQVPTMVSRYRSLIESEGGQVHRHEDWGRRTLAYPIRKVKKAHYFLLNIECSETSLRQLEELFKFSDAVLRHLTLRSEKPEGPSAMIRVMEEEKRMEEEKAAQLARESSRANAGPHNRQHQAAAPEIEAAPEVEAEG